MLSADHFFSHVEKKLPGQNRKIKFSTIVPTQPFNKNSSEPKQHNNMDTYPDFIQETRKWECNHVFQGGTATVLIEKNSIFSVTPDIDGLNLFHS